LWVLFSGSSTSFHPDGRLHQLALECHRGQSGNIVAPECFWNSILLRLNSIVVMGVTLQSILIQTPMNYPWSPFLRKIFLEILFSAKFPESSNIASSQNFFKTLPVPF
jgi:hypothetical protein